ncbi:Wadjet anti-phage system protein JetD domain-containing protein [Labilithrix luteola]
MVAEVANLSLSAGRSISRLTSAERELYGDIVSYRLGPSVRLEQERISFTWLKEQPREHGFGGVVRPT